MARISTCFSGCALAALTWFTAYELIARHRPWTAGIVASGILLVALGACTLILTFRRNAVFTIRSADDPQRRATDRGAQGR